MELGRHIGRGARADVFALGDDRVVKLYWAGTPAAVADTELARSHAVFQTGLPVPEAFERTEIGGRPGIIFERVRGTSLADALGRVPWRLAQVGRLLAELHATIHQQQQVPEIPTPDIREGLAKRISESAVLPPQVIDTVLAFLNQLSDDNKPRLCHADFHAENVLLSPRGPVVIDWPGCLNADPVVDVARTVLIHRLAPLQFRGPKHVVMRIIVQQVERSYLKRYSELRPLDRNAVEAWQLPLAAARLAERIKGEDKVLPGLIAGLLNRIADNTGAGRN